MILTHTPNFLLFAALLLFFFVIVLATQSLRAMLASVFCVFRIRRLPATYQPPADLADLYAQTANELHAQGFQGPYWFLLSPRFPRSTRIVAAAFIHPQSASLAIVYPSIVATAPDALDLSYITRRADGRTLSSRLRNAVPEASANGQSHFAQTLDSKTVAEQWQQHCRLLACFEAPAMEGFASEARLSESLHSAFAGRARLLAEGRLWQDAQGVARPGLRFALRILRFTLSRPRPQMEKGDIPPARLLRTADLLEESLQRELPQRWQWSLFTVEALAFAAVFWPFFNWSGVIAALCMTVFSAGCYLLTWALGYRNAPLRALPSMNIVMLGDLRRPTASRYAWTILMIPLVAIVLGWLALFLPMPAFMSRPTSPSGETLLVFGLLMLIFNYFNLIPLPNTDGNNILKTLFPRHFGVPFLLTSAILLPVVILLGVIGLYVPLSYVLLGMIVFFMFLDLHSLRRERNLTQALDRVPGFAQAERQEKLLRVQAALNYLGKKPPGLLGTILLSRQIIHRSSWQPIPRPQWWALLAGYIAPWVALLAFIVMLFANIVPELKEGVLQAEQAKASWEKQKEETRKQLAESLSIRRAEREARFKKAKTLSFEQLMAELPGRRPPVSDAALAEAETRMGIALPPALKQFYQISDGLSSPPVLPLREVMPAGNSADWQNFSNRMKQLEILTNNGSEIRDIPAFSDWLYLGGYSGEHFDESSAEESLRLYLYQPDSTDSFGGHVLECGHAYDDDADGDAYYDDDADGDDADDKYECLDYGSLHEWLLFKWLYQ